MRKIFSIILIVSAAFGVIYAQTPAPVNEGFVNFDAEIMRGMPVGDSSVIYLVGNVVLYHNGAVITCDSAVRYNPKHMEFFYNVILNKDSTYIYGDRLDYNGVTNLARVFSPLIKMVDGDAVLYTYNLTFNTLDRIGTYFGGATMRQGENRLESYRGRYYAATREFVGVDSVQISNPDYRLISDSVKYNLDDQVASFFTLSYIWNKKGEMLRATKGRYFHKTADYRFTSDSYLLTEKQEVWSDTLDYNSNSQDAILRRNIQIRDEEQKVMAFGDYGQYWGEREDGLLTIDPSLVTFDPESDSLYMRADSMFLFSIGYDLDFVKYENEKRTSEGRLSLSEAQRLHNEGLAADSIKLVPPPLIAADTTALRPDAWGSAGEISSFQRAVIADKSALYAAGDTLTRAMLTSEVYEWMIRSGLSSEDIEGQLLYNEYKARTGEVPDEAAMAAILKQAGFFKTILPELNQNVMQSTPPESGRPIQQADAEEKRSASEGGGSGISGQSQIIENIMTEKSTLTVPGPMPVAEVRPDSITTLSLPRTSLPNLAQDSVKNHAPALYVVPRDSLGMPIIPVDSLGTPLFSVDSLGAPVIERDSLGEPIIPLDSKGKPLFAVDAKGRATVPAVPLAVEPQRDSLQRIVRAYRNVRVYRADFQAVCDSLMGFTKDSTMHMYIDPVLWNEDNQISSEIIDIFTKNKELQRAFFTGAPMMVSKVDSINFNQVQGRTMEAFFRDNNIYRHDVVGNAESYYYMMDDEAQEANAFSQIRCGNISFYFKDKQLIGMPFRDHVSYEIHPIDRIPLDVERFLPGFKWQENRRPTLTSVFTRTIRSTEREHHQNILQPQFPKTERIERNKVQMIQSGQWVDRNESLPVHALEFIHTLQTR